MANIIRNEIFGHEGQYKQALSLPKDALFISAQLSTRGCVNIYHITKEIPHEASEMEKRGFILVRTGADLPDTIFDCHHLMTIGLGHLFEIPTHLTKKI